MPNDLSARTLRRAAERLVRVNARVQEGDDVVVVTDHAMVDIAAAVESAASELGARVVTCIMPVRARDGEEPPPPIAAAMRAARVVFSPVSVSITHTKAMRAALTQGARAILMTAYNEDMLTSPALLDTDFEKQADVCRRLGAAFTEGETVRLTSPRGTDVRFRIDGRTANVLTNVPDPGELAPVPDIEVNVVPVTGSAEGTLISDASIPYLGIGILTEPVVCRMERGVVTSIEGGAQADQIRAAMEAPGNPDCFNVAELGVGLNPNARLSGNMLDDEGVMGTIHIGVGTSHTLGGEIVAPTHYDLLMWDPTIEVDGRIVYRDRTVLV